MANKGAFASEQRFQNCTLPQQHQLPHFIQTSATFPTTQYLFGANMPGSSSTLLSKHSHSLQKQVSRPPQITKASSGPSNVNNPSTMSTAMGTNFKNNNSVLPSNHSTVLLHRPSTRPPLGIKASNLPVSRNLIQQTSGLSGALSGISSNYRSTTIIGTNNNNKNPGGKKQIVPPSTHISSNSTIIPSQNDYLQQNDYVILDLRNAKSLFFLIFMKFYD